MATRHNLLQKRVLAYLIEPDRQRLKEIEQAIDVLLEEPTWTPAWHKGTWDGEHILDIEAADVGADLAMASLLLRDALPSGLLLDVAIALDERVSAVYSKAARASQHELVDRLNLGINGPSPGTTPVAPPQWWYREDNWAAVIHAHAGLAALVSPVLAGTQELHAAGIKRYLQGGFTQDGYCLEGPVYWNYGMQAVLSWHVILDRLNLAHEERESLRELMTDRAAYGTKVASIEGIGPAFADSKSGDRIPATTCEVAAAYLGTDLPSWPRDRRFPSVAQAVAWLLRPESKSQCSRADDGMVYRALGRLTHRDHEGNLLELFVQATTNDDRLPHTHHDMGTWQLMKNGRPVAGDPGYPKDQNFGKRRYEKRQNRADGHPVPTVAGNLDQRLGQRVELKAIPLSPATSLHVLSDRWVRTFAFVNGKLTIEDSIKGPGELVTRVCIPGDSPTAKVEFGNAKVGERALLGTYKDGRQWGVIVSTPSRKVVTKVTC